MACIIIAVCTVGPKVSTLTASAAAVWSSCHTLVPCKYITLLALQVAVILTTGTVITCFRSHTSGPVQCYLSLSRTCFGETSV